MAEPALKHLTYSVRTRCPDCDGELSILSVINGRVVIRDGHLLTADLPNVLSDHRRLARTLFERAQAAGA